MREINKVIAIFGMPRSGTSFLGQIFDSVPNVAYRLEPIFSYRLKNMVDEHSGKSDFEDFFKMAFNASDDNFMNQTTKRQKGCYPVFKKTKPKYLVFKTTRFHNILPSLLKHFSHEELKVISLARHPAGAIYSWISHPNEFPAGADYKNEWLTGGCRKTAKEEFWGFDDWKKVMKLHMDLEQQYRNFKIFQYENIVNNIKSEVEQIFKFAGLELNKATVDFLEASQSAHLSDPYAVYKDKGVASKWKNLLDEEIQEKIISDVINTSLERFLVE